MTTPKEPSPETDAAVRWIVARYCHLVDDRDFDAASALFAEDGRFRVLDQDIEGRAAIREWMDTIPPGLSHMVTNVVTSNGSHADVHAVSDVAASIRSGGGWSVVLVGRYHDTMVGSGRDIRFKQRILTSR